jgi:hypothetical protein
LLTRGKSQRHVAVAAARAEFDEEELEHKREKQRKQEQIRQREDERRGTEERERDRLVETSQAWLQAKRLRWFIRACARELRKNLPSLPAGGWEEVWFALHESTRTAWTL